MRGRPIPAATLLVPTACLLAALIAALSAVRYGATAVFVPVLLTVVVLFWREPLALLATFLFIGVFKPVAILNQLPVDITVALAVMLATVCGYRLASGRARSLPLPFVGMLLFLSILMFVSLDWSLAPEYGQEKLARFLVLTLPAAIAPFILIEDRDDVRRFFWAVAAVALAAPWSPPSFPRRMREGRLASTRSPTRSSSPGCSVSDHSSS